MIPLWELSDELLRIKAFGLREQLRMEFDAQAWERLCQIRAILDARNGKARLGSERPNAD